MTSLNGAHEAEHEPWKAHIRQCIMENLEDVLQDAHRAYLNKISENAFSPPEFRQKLHMEYTRNVDTLRQIAEDEVKNEIEREEQERDFMALTNFDHQEAGYEEPFVLEQAKILEAIRAEASVRPHALAMDQDIPEAEGALFEQGSSSRPLDNPAHFGQRSAKYNPALEPTVSAIGAFTETAPEPESPAARFKREQQEKFEHRAQEIQSRKRRERIDKAERDWSTAHTSLLESISCSSSNTSASSEKDKEKPHIPRMSEEDVINLMIFHDQRWSFIETLTHLQWSDFPWPCLTFAPPKNKDGLTLEALAEYIYAQYAIHKDRSIVREHIKALMRRWHPDRFELRYLSRIADLSEREMVREGAGVVIHLLGDLFGKWNDRELDS